MLQTIRDKTSGWVAWIFLGAIAVVFIFWGIDFQNSANTYAAKVNGERVPAELVRQAWQDRQSRLQQMMRGELPAEMARMQREALLDQFVRTELLTQRAQERGYRVSDEELARRIIQFPELQVDGKFSADRYSALLRQQGRTEAQFEEQLRAELEIEQMQSGLIDTAFITPQEAQRRYALEQEQREVRYAMLPVSNYLESAQVTEEQIKAYYETNRQNYQTPERADLEYVEVTRADAEKQVQVDDEALRNYYEQVKDRYIAPERRRARHVLVAIDEGVDDAAAQKLAQDVTEKAKAGGDFAALAKQYSKDPGSAEQGGDLGWAERGMFVGPFEEALFAMQPGEIRGPVKSEFGYHVIKLEEVDAGATRGFDEVRAELEGEYRRDQAQSIFESRTQTLSDDSFAALTELRSVAEKLGLEVKTISDFTRQGGAEFGADPQVIETVFSEDVLERSQNSPLLSIGEDRSIVVRVTKHEPSKPLPLEAVRPQIESNLKMDAAKSAAEKAGQDAIKRLQSGEDWDKIIADLNAQAVAARSIQRTDAEVPPDITQLAFRAPAPKEGTVAYSGAALPDGGYAIVGLSNVVAGDPSKEAATERESRLVQDARQRGNEEFSAYISELERTADVERNPSIFE